MSLTTLLQNIKNTRVYRLVYDGRVLAVRVAMYNVKLEKMEYFDFYHFFPFLYHSKIILQPNLVSFRTFL